MSIVTQKIQNFDYDPRFFFEIFETLKLFLNTLNFLIYLTCQALCKHFILRGLPSVQ